MIAKILFVVIAFASVSLVALVLIQQSKGDTGSAFGGGGGSQSLFGSRGSANFLSRMTSIMVTVFFIASTGLAYYYTKINEVSYSTEVNQESSVLDSLQESDIPVAPDTTIPDVPEATIEPFVEESIDESAMETEIPTVEPIQEQPATNE